MSTRTSDALALLVECGFHGDPASRTVAQDQCARFLRAAGTLDEAAIAQSLVGWLQPDAARQWALDVTGPVVARSADSASPSPSPASRSSRGPAP